MHVLAHPAPATQSYVFVPRIDFVRGNTAAKATTICVRLCPSKPPHADDYVALFKFPVPKDAKGVLAAAACVPGTKRRVRDFATPELLQHGCIAMLPMWGGDVGHVRLDDGHYVAVYFNEPPAAGLFVKMTSYFTEAKVPELVSISGQELHASSMGTDLTVVEPRLGFRPCVDPATLVKTTSSNEDDTGGEFVRPTIPRELLNKLHLVACIDDSDDQRLTDLTRPAFMTSFKNLYIAVRAYGAAGIRKFDLLRYQPAHDSQPALVRRCTNLRTLAKMSEPSPLTDSDWLEAKPLSLPAGKKQSMVMRRLGEVAVAGATAAVSGFHGGHVSLSGGTRLVVLGGNEAATEFLALAPLTMELVWVSSDDKSLFML